MSPPLSEALRWSVAAGETPVQYITYVCNAVDYSDIVAVVVSVHAKNWLTAHTID